MTTSTWKTWLLFGLLAAGAHFVFGAGWSESSGQPRRCERVTELSQSDSCAACRTDAFSPW